MKRRTRNRLIWATVVILSSLFIYMNWYKSKYSMGVSPTYSINTPDSDKSLLIATQSSEFKNKIVENIISNFKDKGVFIRIIDVKDLAQNQLSDWNATLIFHTWEYGRPPEGVRYLVENNIEISNAIFFTTSGSVDAKIEGVDAITGASLMTETDAKSQEAIRRINKVMNASKGGHALSNSI